MSATIFIELHRLDTSDFKSIPFSELLRKIPSLSMYDFSSVHVTVDEYTCGDVKVMWYSVVVLSDTFDDCVLCLYICPTPATEIISKYITAASAITKRSVIENKTEVSDLTEIKNIGVYQLFKNPDINEYIKEFNIAGVERKITYH